MENWFSDFLFDDFSGFSGLLWQEQNVIAQLIVFYAEWIRSNIAKIIRKQSQIFTDSNLTTWKSQELGMVSSKVFQKNTFFKNKLAEPTTHQP